ncbi:MAG: helix-turn-helix domain-containing protein [Solirubrobacterales bacterium]
MAVNQPHAQDSTRPLLMTVAEAAREMRISKSTLYVLLAKRELRGLKVEGARRIPTAEVEAWIARQLGGAEAES